MYGVTWSTVEGGSCFQTGYVFNDIGSAAIAARNGPFDQIEGVQVDIFPGAELFAEWQMYGDVEKDDDISARVLTVFSVRYESSRSLCEERDCAVLWRYGDKPRCSIHDKEEPMEYVLTIRGVVNENDLFDGVSILMRDLESRGTLGLMETDGGVESDWAWEVRPEDSPA